MDLNIFENVKESVALIDNLEYIWFDPDRVMLSTKRTAKARPISPSEVGELRGFFSKVYYQHTGNACEECRDHALLLLEIQFGEYLDRLMNRYGG